MEETPKYHTSETPSDDARITIAWPEWNDVMQVLGVTVVYPGEITEQMLIRHTKVELTEDAVQTLFYALDYHMEYKLIDRETYEHYRKVLMGWVNG